MTGTWKENNQTEHNEKIPLLNVQKHDDELTLHYANITSPT